MKRRNGDFARDVRAYPAQMPTGTDSKRDATVEVRTEGLGKSFGEHVVLRGVDVEVAAGEIVAIVGASGSGKTVLLDLIIGLLNPSEGRVLVADHSRPGAPLVDPATLEDDEFDAVRRHWAVVFQRNALFSGSVYENIALLLREHEETSEEEIERRARAALGACALDVEDVLHKDRDNLSGGMAKRVAIARAIALDPIVIFYDEPTTGLDPVVSGGIHELIWNLHHTTRADGARRTTLVITHDRELLRRLAPRVVMLHQGRVCYDGAYEGFGRADCPPAREYLEVMPALHARPTPG